MKSTLNVLLTFVLLSIADAVGIEEVGSKIGCQINNNMEFVSGLTGSVYYYPWRSYNAASKTGAQQTALYTSKAYLAGGYVGDGSIISQDHTVYTAAGVIANDVTATELYFRNDNPCSTSGNCAGEVWLDLDYFTNADGSALSVPFKNFAFNMNGYLVPNITGQYTLNLKYIDDLAIINIGSNGYKSPNCCGSYSPTSDVSGNNTIQSIWTSNGPSGINQVVLQLVAGVAYPIEIFYVNRGGAGALQLEYIDPNGDSHRTFDGFIYHLSSDAVCNYVEKHVSTIQWDQPTSSSSYTTDTSVVTATNSYFSTSHITFTGTLYEETEFFYVPMPTVSTYWTGLSTFTSTSYSTTTDTDGNPVTSSVIYVRTPESTTTELWTGSYTYTTTSSAVSTDSLGSTVTSPIVVVKTPEFTTTVPWTGSVTSTSTSSTVVTGTDGNPTTETVFVVETPESTITVPWTGSVTSSWIEGLIKY